MLLNELDGKGTLANTTSANYHKLVLSAQRTGHCCCVVATVVSKEEGTEELCQRLIYAAQVVFLFSRILFALSLWPERHHRMSA